MSKIGAVLLTLAAGLACSPLSAQEGWAPWKGEMDIGYTQSSGPVDAAFPRGMDVSFLGARRLFSRVYAEAGFALGMVPLRDAASTGYITCGNAGCFDEKEAGYSVGVPFGLLVPLKVGASGRLLQVGAGGHYLKYGVANGVAGYGSRSGTGWYVRSSIDLSDPSSRLVVGLMARLSRVSTSGSRFERIETSKGTDSWPTLDLMLRF